MQPELGTDGDQRWGGNSADAGHRLARADPKAINHGLDEERAQGQLNPGNLAISIHGL
ncbi:hypothetical protein chiPu_0022582, partial [Chiloscyllium punctatum]|nr:hypothetical protein [Chiloscyllium punctatum]